ncbi:uncharacterized protein PO2_contig-042-36 [Mycobacterium sp. PO2]|nr:uncharacterized protein PO2_contig-042-36 [Mycobacterium sp. PO2]
MALGVGFAVANSSAVAHADSESEPSASPGSENDADSSSAGSSESSKQSDDATDDGDESGGEPADDAGLDDVTVGEEVATDDESEDSDLTGEADEEDPVVDEVEEPADADGSVDADQTATSPPAGEESSASVDGAVEEQSGDVVVDDDANAESAAPDIEELTEVDEDVAGGTVEETTAETVSDLVEVKVPATDESAIPLASAATTEEAITEEVDVLTTVVSSVLSPFADPEAPAPTPWFDALLAWVRRQITHTFFNESPEWGPIEGRQVVTGQVLFDLNAFDPNGDPLTYKISQPEHGLVVRDPLSGEFIYTPTTVVTGEPLTDSFKVVISDSGEHLKGLVGLVQRVFHFLARAVGLAEPDEVALMVNVTVNPIVEVPPVIVATPAALGFNGEPIVVSPVLAITDLDSESLSSATVTIGDPDSGDVLDYDTSLLPEDVSAEFSGGVLTITGSASVAEYQQLLASVTLTAAGAGVKTVSFRVVDAHGNPNAVPAATVVTVLGVPGAVVAPVVVATPVAAGVVGSPVVVSPVVVITDLDSEALSSATVTVDGADDVLGYDADLVPSGVTAEFSGGVLTFTGAASVSEYQQLLASVTLTSGSAGVTTVSFRVVDAQGNPNAVPAATVVTVLGVPGAVVAPVVVATPVAAGVVGSPVVVSPVVVITDLDSESLSSATVTVDDADDVLSYDVDLLPENVSAEFSGGMLTFTGSASVVQYQQLLASVTLTAAGAGVSTVSFAVVDAQGNASALPAATVVTVVGVPGAVVAPVVVATPVAAGVVGSPVVVSPVLVITDLDSEALSSATVTIGDPESSDVLDFDTSLLPEDVSAEFSGGVLRFTGSASVSEYQQLLASVTLTAAGAGVSTVSFRVVDAQGNPNAVPAATVVTVVGVPGAVVAPVVVATPVAAGVAGSPVVVSPVLVITDLDSEALSSATVTVDDADDVLSYDLDLLPENVSAEFSGGVLTFTGSASVSEYQQLLASVTLTAAGVGVSTVSFAVVDAQGNASALPAATVVTVVGVPGVVVAPVVVATPVAAGVVGSPVVVSPVLVVTDLDSEALSSATVTIGDFDAGDVLGHDASLLPGTVSAVFTDGLLTFTGAATVAEYEQLLRSVTLTSNTVGVKAVSFEVVDSSGATSALPAATLVTVVGVPGAVVAPVVVATPVAAGVAGSPVVVSPILVITDLDSESLSSATVSIGDPDSGGVLDFDTSLLPEDVSAEFAGGVLTFTGSASVSEYQQLLASVTLTAAGAGVSTVSFAVTDAQGNPNAVPAATVVTVVGVPGAVVAPVVVATPVAAGVVGSPVVVSPVVVITDLDSESLSSATVTVDDANDVLGFDADLLPDDVTAEFVGGVLTFTGAASVSEYQQLLSSVRLSSQTAGLKSVSFAVVDATDTSNVLPASTLVTAIGLPAATVAPVVVATPVAGGTTNSAIVVSSVVVITDLDSDMLASATVAVDNAGDVIGYDAGLLPGSVSAGFSGGVLTFTGAASVAEYEQLLASVTLTSDTAEVKTVSFAVADASGVASTLPALTLVTVLGLPATQIAPVVVAAPAAAGTTGSPLVVSPVIAITDVDSTELSSATVSLNADAAAGGDTLGFDAGLVPQGVAANFANGVLTFTGVASIADYQQLLASVSITAAHAGVKTVSFGVVDASGTTSGLPAATLVTVLGLPTTQVAPVVVAAVVAAGTAGSPVVVSPVVLITDVDSTELSSATVSLDQSDLVVGDVLGFDADLLPEGVSAEYIDGVLTFTGPASLIGYQQLLASVTLTSNSAGVKTVGFAVVDGQGRPSALPAETLVTVVGAPSTEVAPVVVATPVAAGVTGSPVMVSPVVVITDLDSDVLSAATVTVDDVGDVLGYDAGLLPGTVSAGFAGGVLSFTGAASVAVYEQLLASVTLTSNSAGVKTVSFVVADELGNESILPAATLVTVVGAPGAVVAPVVVASPVAAGVTGSPVVVSPVVVITDLDSDVLSAATVTVDDVGDVLGYDAGLLPGTVSAGFAGGVLSFTGAASVAEYEQLLASVTLTSNTAGVKAVSFEVVDGSGATSALPAATLVTVVGVPGAVVAPVVVATPVAAGTTSSPILVSPVVVITDLDSDVLSAATVTVDDVGDVLGYDAGLLPATVSAGFSGGVLSFTGSASVAVYEQLLASVTLTSNTAGVKTVSFAVTDDAGIESVLPAATLVTVVGAPSTEVAPVVVATPVAAGTTSSPILVSPVVVITDLDSDVLSSATVTVDDVGDVLGYDAGLLPATVSAGFSGGVLSFTGAASVAEYEQLLASVTLTSNTAGVKAVSFEVVDGSGATSALPAATLVTVVGVPGAVVAPVVVATPVAAGTTSSPILVSPVVVITDLDSDVLSAATVTVDDASDVLGYDFDVLPENVAGEFVDGVLTFTGAASVAVYEQLLASVTLTSNTAGVKTVSFAVTDDAGIESVLPAATLVTVVGAPSTEVAPVVVATPVAAGTTSSPILVSPVVVITDLDSNVLSSATVTVDDANDVLGYDAGLLPATVSAGFAGGVLSFTGSASVAEYEQLLASVTLTSNTAGVKTVSFAVTDDAGSESILPAATLVTVVGAPSTEVAPVVVASPVAAGTTSSPVVVSPVVMVTDLDSSELLSATVSLDQDAVAAGDSLNYAAELLPESIEANFVDGVLTFTGLASVTAYQQLLSSVTISTASAGVKTVSFAVTDSTDTASAIPTTTLVTVLAAPTTEVSPVVFASIVNVGYSAGGTPIPIDANLIILDVDSANLKSATVTVGGYQAGDELTWGTLPQNVVASLVDGLLTFTGSASVADYQQLLRSVNIATTAEALTAIRTISFRVVDGQDNQSIPGVVAVTVTAVPEGAAPLVLASVVNVNYSAGGTPVPVDANLIILDLDSDSLQSATVTIGDFELGDELTWGTPPQDVDANFTDGVLTFAGEASLEDYQQLLRSVSIQTSSGALTAIRSISFRVTDTQAQQSLPGVVAVTVVAVPQSVPPLVVPTVPAVVYTAGDPALNIATLLNLVDVDSQNLSGATIAITGGNLDADETLSFTSQSGISGVYNNGTLTLNGTATVAQYEAAIRSLTFSTNSSADATIRTVSIVVTDAQGSSSLPGSVTVTVLAAPVNLAPLVTTSLLGPVYTAGNDPEVVDSLVTIIDLDSTMLQGATIQISDGLTDGDVLAFTSPSGSSISGTYVEATGTLTLSGTATVAQYRQALRSVTFAADGNVPTATRTISFTVTDTQGGTSPEATAAVSVQETTHRF